MELMTNKYELIFDNSEDTALVRITEGKFANFVYQYQEVGVNDEEDDGSLPVKFSYALKEAPESYSYEDEETEKKEFETIIGDILYDIVVNSNKVKETSGNNDTK